MTLTKAQKRILLGTELWAGHWYISTPPRHSWRSREVLSRRGLITWCHEQGMHKLTEAGKAAREELLRRG